MFEDGFPGSLRGNDSCLFIKIQKGVCPGLWLAFKTRGCLSRGQGKEKQEQEEQRTEGERWPVGKCPAVESQGGIPVIQGKPGPP